MGKNIDNRKNKRYDKRGKKKGVFAINDPTDRLARAIAALQGGDATFEPPDWLYNALREAGFPVSEALTPDELRRELAGVTLSDAIHEDRGSDGGSDSEL